MLALLILFGGVIAAACNFVLKTKGSESYGDRHLTPSPNGQMAYVVCAPVWRTGYFGSIPNLSTKNGEVV